jgi:hypothetical protein
VDILVTSSRLPFALEEIRKLGRCGHRVYASDTFGSAPGSHSRYALEHFVTASPLTEPERFLDDLERILTEHPVDRLIPSFEEVFTIVQDKARFDRLTEVFAPDFETLVKLHDKVRFIELARELGLLVPTTILAHDRAELSRATEELGAFFARPAYTRGGVMLYTNTGPLAGEVTLEECEPTAQHPYVVQPLVTGTDVCTFGIAHHGKLVAHSAYVHPLTLEHAGGIVFESVDIPETVEIARRVVEATGYHGQISLDFLATPDGLSVVECNPRPTSGLTVMPDEMFNAGLMNRVPPGEVLVAPPGMRRQLSLGVVRNMVVHWDEMPENLHELVSGDPDIYADPQDWTPLLYQLVAYGRVMGYRFKTGRISRSDIMQGYFHDITWNGARIATTR